MADRHRPTFTDLPAQVRGWAEEVLGSPVAGTVPATGGYSPGVTDSLFCADGRSAFLKASHPSLNPDSPGLLRSELRALRAIPAGLPIAALLDAFDEGADGWVAVLLERVPGVQAPLPWTDTTIEAALASLAELVGALTPAPVGGFGGAGDALAPLMTLWPELAGVDDLDPWCAARLPALDAAGCRALATVDGDTLLHLDLRADNLMLREDGRLIIVDWAWAARGAAWVDPALLAIEFISSAAPEVDADAWIEYVAGAYRVATDSIVDLLAGILGFFERTGRLPDPPGLPTLRDFQRFQAAALRRWLRRSPHARRSIRG